MSFPKRNKPAYSGRKNGVRNRKEGNELWMKPVV